MTVPSSFTYSGEEQKVTVPRQEALDDPIAVFHSLMKGVELALIVNGLNILVIEEGRDTVDRYRFHMIMHDARIESGSLILFDFDTLRYIAATLRSMSSDAVKLNS